MPIDIVEWRKQYYEKNKEKMLAASKEYYAKNKEKCKASKDYYKEYYKVNRASIIARQKAYYYKIKFDKTEAEKPAYYKASTVASKQAFINAKLADLLVKKEAFKKKLAEEAAANNNVDIV